MKLAFSLVCVALLLSVGVSQPGPDNVFQKVGKWIAGAASGTGKFLYNQVSHRLDQMYQNGKLVVKDPLGFVKGAINPVCHAKAAAKCVPQAVNQAKQEAERQAANGVQLSKFQVAQKADDFAVTCYYQYLRDCY